jgi:hypothetical protein
MHKLLCNTHPFYFHLYLLAIFNLLIITRFSIFFIKSYLSGLMAINVAKADNKPHAHKI